MNIKKYMFKNIYKNINKLYYKGKLIKIQIYLVHKLNNII